MTMAHWDLDSVLLVVLRGSKTIWYSDKLQRNTNTFKDTAEMMWKIRENRYWDPIGSQVPNDMNEQKEWGTYAPIYDKAFQKVTLASGDALYIPRRCVHAVSTPADTIMVSINVTERN